MAEFGEEACGPDSHPSKSLWQSFLLKVKIPFVCGKNLIKKEKPNRKAHWFLFIIGGKKFHTDSTHI